MVKSKRLTTKSGITIPKDSRASTGFFPGMAIDMETVKEGILIRPHVPVCRFCGSPENIRKISGMETCSKCRDTLRKELERHGE